MEDVCDACGITKRELVWHRWTIVALVVVVLLQVVAAWTDDSMSFRSRFGKSITVGADSDVFEIGSLRGRIGRAYISIEDDDQRAGAYLACVNKDSQLELGTESTPSIYLSATSDRAALALFGPDTAPATSSSARAIFESRPGDGTYLTFFDDAGETRVRLGSSHDGTPVFEVAGAEGIRDVLKR